MDVSEINNAVVVSDLHSGDKLGLCPPEGLRLDEGGRYDPSPLQLKVWALWREFWDVHVPKMTRREPYVIVVNGEGIDGVHHNSDTQITHNIKDQENLAVQIMRPLVARKMCEGIYWIRGTEAHSGVSGRCDERIAERLGAIKDEQGNHSRWAMRLRIGFGLADFAHHIGTTGSMAYETTGPLKELEQLYVECARWGHEIPDVVIRSHRHRCAEARIPIKKHNVPGLVTSCTTACWQLKTPFAYRVAGARRTQPQIGGTVIRCGDEEIYTRMHYWDIEPPPVEVPKLTSPLDLKYPPDIEPFPKKVPRTECPKRSQKSPPRKSRPKSTGSGKKRKST
jgi:hypothetical protein